MKISSMKNQVKVSVWQSLRSNVQKMETNSRKVLEQNTSTVVLNYSFNEDKDLCMFRGLNIEQHRLPALGFKPKKNSIIVLHTMLLNLI